MAHHITTQEAVETWKLGHRFVLDVYRLTNRLPKEEHYGLIPKIRTSSVKIASNIVEGYARKSNDFYSRHLSESQVALEETKYSLLVSRDLGYLSDSQYDRIMADAEALSERLEGLQLQLGVAAPDTQPQPEEFAPRLEEAEVTKRHGRVRRAFSWFLGGQQRVKRDEPQVWVEEHPAYNYLDELNRD